MTHAAVEPRSNRTRLIILVVVVLLVAGVIVFAMTRKSAPSGSETPPAAAPSAQVLVTPNKTMAPPPTASAPASPDPVPAGCTVVTEGFVPTRYTIERFGVDEPIVALDQDGKGNIAAPPLDEPRMASWWSGGPKPGDAKGKAVLSIHTYRNGNALGNELFADGASQFQPGDVLKLYGTAGQVQCYEYTDAEKIFVKDYDPDSTVMLDPEGPAALTIIICWDFEKSTEDWNSRVFFHFTPVTPGATA